MTSPVKISSAHTPAPWTAGETKFSQTALVKGIQDANGNYFAGVNSDEYAVANARLIAAAPELLEACKNIFDNLHIRSESNKHWSSSDQVCFEQLQSCIAKAEGRA